MQVIRNKLEFAEENPDIFDTIDVLDEGFVRLVDFFGDDSRVVDSARVSYQNQTRAVRSDAGLIDYLVRHEHQSPLEQANVTFHIKVPLFVMSQLKTHRTGRRNEASYRYSEAPEQFYIPEKARIQSKTNKQGSLTSPSVSDVWMRRIMEESTRISKTSYDTLREKGVARELARIILPQNLYTEAYWNQDLRNLLGLIRLRDDPHAQWEIQEYARAMYSIVKRIFPLTVDSWERNVKNSITLSQDEIGIVQRVNAGTSLYEAVEESNLSKGAKREATEKLQRLWGL